MKIYIIILGRKFSDQMCIGKVFSEESKAKDFCEKANHPNADYIYGYIERTLE